MTKHVGPIEVKMERCIICQEWCDPFNKARADDGPMCSMKCWLSFAHGARLLGKIKDFMPWRLTPRSWDVRPKRKSK